MHAATLWSASSKAAGVTHPNISSLDRLWQQLPGLLKPAGRVLHVLLCAPPRQARPGISPRGSPVGGGGHWPMAWLPRGF
jgi:hypothetical protein